jgi:MarR family transcriptional regulator for hemolysin
MRKRRAIPDHPSVPKQRMAQAPDRTLGFVIHDVARLLRKRFEQKARDLGLTRSQWQVLAWLSLHEGIHQGGLADLLDLEPITLTRIVDKLGEAGFLERRAHPTDRRIRQLHLLPKARPTLERMWSIGAEAREEALHGVRADDRERLLETLLAMRSNLADTSAAPAERGGNLHHG